MPAAKKAGDGGLVAHLTSLAPKKNVNNTVPLPRYYRSLDLLMTQVRAHSAIACPTAAGQFYHAYWSF